MEPVRYRSILLIGIILLSGAMSAALCSSERRPFSNQPPTISRGHLDLSDWDFKQAGIVPLTGEWRFYWKQLLSPQEAETMSKRGDPSWIRLPGDWNHATMNGSHRSAMGYATCTLVIDFPEKDTVIGIRIRDIHTAYRLYINEKRVADIGVVSSDPALYKPGFDNRTIYFSPDSNPIRLTLQIANFSLPPGGPVGSLELGDAETIAERGRSRGYLDLFVFGLLVILAFYHLMLYRQRGKDPSTLLFSFFCLIIAVRTILNGERIGYNLFFDWPASHKLDILSLYLSLPALAMFLKSIFPDHLSIRWVRTIQGLALLNTVIIVFTPAAIYSRLLIPNLICLLIFTGYLIYAMGAGYRRGVEGTLLTAAGLLIVFSTLASDALLANGIIHAPYLSHFGMLGLILSQSYLLSVRFSRAFATVESYGVGLKTETKNRREAEARLIQSERRFRDLADFLPIAVGEYDFNLNFLYANFKALQMFGYTRADLEAGVNAKDMIPEEYRSTIIERVSALRMGEVPKPLELNLLRKDGRKIWGEIYPSLIYEGETWVGIRACFVDLTERKETGKKLRQARHELELKVEQRTVEISRAKEAAEAANLMKSEFLANISHELRNPMHQILSYSRYGIEKIDRPREKLLHYFTQTRTAARRLMFLLNDLLDLSKMESGKMDFRTEQCQIKENIEEIVAEFSQLLQDKNIQLDMVLDGEDMIACCDPFKMGQVLRNLLANAIEFSPNDKKIEIVAEKTVCRVDDRDQPGIRIAVKDQGVGIPVEELESIFEKFTQSSRTKTGAGGTGLGLAICREIIEAHHGKIWASNNTDNGATFCFCIPLDPAME
ncbi:MAG: ATP-binding protein [bacterium]